ncbi:sodium:solute symporter family protein [Lacrimispora sp. NSJ-141]|uniref:Sodium:solute symporter family protein n=1 Tax=Lientehia hominis TaxID=2897778 RepID=A0AAP2RIC2_9FIRM|nr:sodium:solute symporter family protein [Lientehia hominis]MCD2492562.1 sodium:solute symporter family protein [Lientehia hominis]
MTLGLILVLCMGAVMLTVGLWASKRIKTSDDYYVGGRSLGPLVTISTQCATFVGGGMTLGWIGMGYRYGVGAAWYGAPQALGFFFMAVVMVKAMRRGNSFISLPDWFDSLYHNKFLSIVSALVCLIVPITWVTAQTTAAARMLETIGVPYLVGVLVIGGVVILYSTVGGYLAVAYTDTLQWILLLLIFAGTVPFAIYYAGGFGGITSGVEAHMMNPMTVQGMPGYTIPLWIVSGLVSGMGLQSSYQRIYSAKTDRVAKQGLVVTGIATIFFAVLTAFVGMAVLRLGAPDDLINDKVWPWFLNNYMPQWVALIYTVCIMMATMSTADSMLNSISLTITHDLYSKFINPKADDKKVLRVGIIVSGIFGILALYWATGGSWMIALFGMSYTLGAGPLAGAVMTAALMKKKANAKCLAAGMILGAAVGFITLKVPALSGIPAGGTVFSFGSCILVCIVGSLIWKNKEGGNDL